MAKFLSPVLISLTLVQHLHLLLDCFEFLSQLLIFCCHLCPFCLNLLSLSLRIGLNLCSPSLCLHGILQKFLVQQFDFLVLIVLVCLGNNEICVVFFSLIHFFVLHARIQCHSC